MRIASLLPSATEIICALGLGDQLVAISHRCDYPPEIEGVAVVTRAVTAAPADAAAHADAAGHAAAADAAARATGTDAADAAGHAAPADAAAHAAGHATRARRSAVQRRFSDPGAGPPDDELGPSTLAAQLLLQQQPELIVVGHAGRGPGPRELEAALVSMEISPEILSLAPVTLEGIFHSVITLGAMTEAEDDAIELLEVLREELGEIEQTVVARHDGGLRPKRVVVLEGLSPLLASGRWVPEQVRRAGGWELLGREGEPSSPTTWEAIRDVDPEMLLFAPAGLTILGAQAQWREIDRPGFWDDLEAVKRGQVFFVEPVFLSRPGPRVIDGVAMMAEIFDPEGFTETSPPDSWTPLVE